MSGALEAMASGKVSIPPSDMSVGKSGSKYATNTV